jgi:hypothetical protein
LTGIEQTSNLQPRHQWLGQTRQIIDRIELRWNSFRVNNSVSKSVVIDDLAFFRNKIDGRRKVSRHDPFADKP